MKNIAPVVRRINDIEQNRERLAELGKMAAGLAHELNNPAAAAQRAADQLAQALRIIDYALRAFVEAGVERAEAQQLLALHQQAMEGAANRSPLAALDAADAEDALRDALEDLGVPRPWELSEPLAAAGVDAAWLEQVAALAGPATPKALKWVAATLTAGDLVAELKDSTQRMSDLVGAVKTYAYMDRGGLVEVDLHEGLESTLAVMGHMLKHTQIKVVRDYDRSLPKLTIRGSELNQVWTNLIHNAIDALGDSGTITITTRRDGECAVVDVSDDGPGIPAACRPRIFESFFTTKEVGQGHRLGTRGRQAHRRRPPRRVDHPRLRAGPHDVPRQPAIAAGVTPEARDRARSGQVRSLGVAIRKSFAGTRRPRRPAIATRPRPSGARVDRDGPRRSPVVPIARSPPGAGGPMRGGGVRSPRFARSPGQPRVVRRPLQAARGREGPDGAYGGAPSPQRRGLGRGASLWRHACRRGLSRCATHRRNRHRVPGTSAT